METVLGAAANAKHELKQSPRTIISNNLFLLRYAFRHTPMFVFLSGFYPAFHAAVIYVEHVLGIKLITDAIQYDKPFTVVITYMIVICSLILIALGLGRLYYHGYHPKGLEKLNLKIKEDLYKKASKIDLACYDNPEYYNEFVLSISEVQNRAKSMLDYIGNLTGNVTSIIFISGFFIYMDKLGLLFVAVAITSSIYVGLQLNMLRFKMRLELNTKERKRNYVSRVYYLADYAKELRLHNVTSKLQEDFHESNGEMRTIIRHYSKRMMLLTFLQRFVCGELIISGLYLLYITFRTLVQKAFSYGTAVALVNSAWQLNNSVRNLSRLVNDFQENSLYIDKIIKFLSYEEKIMEKNGALPMPSEPALIELRNVSFSYTPDSAPIIKNLSLTIRPYEKIALVGHNGAGKTTLVKLLMRLYDVTEGQILVNGTDIREYKLNEYRASFGSVFQDYQLFAATLAENVLMDEVTDHPDQADNIIASLHSSGFSKRLREMELGIRTPLTREFEETGTNLSGGEAQKVAISRVFARPIHYMILDEPSSALDPISEYHTNQAMLEATNRKTVIFISHRLSTTRMADRIYMLEDGQIVEQGSHDELIAQGGQYAEMFNLQAERYRIVGGTALAASNSTPSLFLS